jgi:hypothetical protein
MINPFPRRRRGQCQALATLLAMAACALALGWLAWQASIVHHRQTLLATITSEGGSYCSFGSQPVVGPAEYSLDVPGLEIIRVPLIRRLLGDRAIHCIVLPRAFAQQEQVAVAFPDAALSHVGDFPHFH